MNYISKLLWGFISTMICIVYRSEASIVCTASLLESFQTNTCNKNACNNLTNCHYTQDFFTVRYPIPDDGTQVCAKNKYVESCRNASGQTVTIPGRFDSTCVNGFVCKDCPSGPGGTFTARKSFKHDISPYTRGTIIYLCSNKDANNQQLGSNYQMKYEIINCSIVGTNGSYNTITDCFVRSGIITNDGTGSYTFVNSCYYSTI